MLIDIHAHLFYDMINNSDYLNKITIPIVLNCGLDKKTNRIVRHMSETYTFAKPCYGYYPENIAHDKESEIEEEIAWIKKNKPFAISEIGLDGTYDSFEKQEKYFRRLVKLAIELDIPAIVHTRKAEAKILTILDEYNYKKIILHCFSGSKKLITKAKDSYYFSIPANINRSSHFQMLTSIVPIERLFTETDSPFLSPMRNETNTPNNIRLTIKKIAEIKEMSEKEIEKKIYNNFIKLFSE